MQIRIVHRFDAPPGRVSEAVLSDELQARLASLPNVAERTVTSLERRPDGSLRRTVRYRYGGRLPAPVQRAVGEAVSWDEVAELSPSGLKWTFRIEPHVFRDAVRCRGVYRFVPDGEGSLRVVEVELEVGIPVVGAMVERAIADGLRQTLDAEAEVLAAYLKELDG